MISVVQRLYDVHTLHEKADVESFYLDGRSNY